MRDSCSCVKRQLGDVLTLLQRCNGVVGSINALDKAPVLFKRSSSTLQTVALAG